MDLGKFSAWLVQNGAEILPTTNEYEAIRFKGREIGVLYKSGKTSNAYTSDTINCFNKNKKWSGKPINVGRQNTYKKEKVKLLERDGENCFLCGKFLGDDITLEHLIALSSGGKNNLSNMVLMHDACNKQVSNIPISEKVKLAISYRILNNQTPYENKHTISGEI